MARSAHPPFARSEAASLRLADGLAEDLGRELAPDDRARHAGVTDLRLAPCVERREVAELPVPQGERSTRPGGSVVQVRTAPSGSRSRNMT